MSYVMKASEFIEKLINIALNLKTLYVMGCFGAPMNSANKARYTQNNEYNKRASRTKMIKNASSDTFGFDCVCLIKGVLWGFNADKTKTYGGAKYGSNGVKDESADIFFKNRCKASNDWSKIEAGEAVWMKGHIGVYIGDGLAVECTPAWKNCVQITAVGNIGKKSGYNTRTWTSHGKISYIDYSKSEAVKPSTNTTNSTNKINDRDKPSAWAKIEWEKATARGVLDGTNPKDPLTREQLAVVLDRLGLLG